MIRVTQTYHSVNSEFTLNGDTPAKETFHQEQTAQQVSPA